MRILDRYIVKSFLINYLLAFGVMVGMYVLLDLIINFDKFTRASGAHGGNMVVLVGVLSDIASFYSYQILVIFQQVAPAIPLLAAGFTMVRMTRHHELTAMLASGVSLYRVAAPIVLCAFGFSLLVIVDQEVLMPNCVDKLLRRHDEVGKADQISRGDPLYFVRDKDNSLLVASRYDSRTRELSDLRIIKRNKEGVPIGRVMAAKARWVTPETDPKASEPSWKLEGTRQIDDSFAGDPANRIAEVVDDYYYHTGLTPEQLDLVFSKKAAEFISSSQLQTLALNSPGVTQDSLVKVIHTRFTQPIMNLILLLIGIPFLLTRDPKQLIINMIYCTVVTSSCFVMTFVLFQMAGTYVAGIYVPAVVGAWLPILIFGPLAAAMLDAIRT